jgi:Outer membrane protein beta-barrel domain
MRKKLLFLLLASGLALPTLAQTERGAKLIGVTVGNARYTTFNYADRKEFEADLVPSVGWFVADNLMLGAGLNLGYSGYRSELITTNYSFSIRSRSLGVGLLPQARYYLPFGSKHRLFAHLSGGLTRYWSRAEITEGPQPSTIKNKETERQIYGGLGYNYFLSPNVALEALAGYRRTNDRNLSEIPAGAVNVRP